MSLHFTVDAGTADTCLWQGSLTLSGNIIYSTSPPMTTWPPHVPAHTRRQRQLGQRHGNWSRADSQCNTTDRALLHWELSASWQNSPGTRMLAMFRGTVLWQAFWTHCQYNPSSTLP